MTTGTRKFGRALVVVYLLTLHGLLAYLLFERYIRDRMFLEPMGLMSISNPLTPTPVPSPIPVPEHLSDMSTPEPPSISDAPLEAQTDSLDLVVPVVGVKRSQLADTFAQARSEDRKHEAIDIMAPAGTPVVAAGDGEIVKFWDSERGGISIYQLSRDRKYVYYYAHLQRRADGLRENQFVARGTVIGYVGDTGNSGKGNYHLHFGIYQVVDPKRHWDGTPINPYPILLNATELSSN